MSKKRESAKRKALEKIADKMLEKDEQAQKLKEKGKNVDVDKFKKIAELHNFWFQGIKSVYPDQYLWRIEKGDCSVLGKL